MKRLSKNARKFLEKNLDKFQKCDIINIEIKKGIDIMKTLKVLPYILAWPVLAIVNFFYCGILGAIESAQDTNREIRATWATGKTWKERG